MRNYKEENLAPRAAPAAASSETPWLSEAHETELATNQRHRGVLRGTLKDALGKKELTIDFTQWAGLEHLGKVRMTKAQIRRLYERLGESIVLRLSEL